MEILELLENPLAFFKKKREFSKAFILFLISSAVFIIMSELMIQLGLSIFQRTVNPVYAMAINYSVLIIGFFICAFLASLILRLVRGNNIISIYTVVAYAGVPLMFFWIPHILPVLILAIWSLLILTIGIKETCEISYKKSAIVVIMFIIFVVTLSYGVQNFIVLPKLAI